MTYSTPYKCVDSLSITALDFWLNEFAYIKVFSVFNPEASLSSDVHPISEVCSRMPYDKVQNRKTGLSGT